ncbi:LysM peptidoglycan-binding domain-containing protein [Bacillus xiapuensis]|uniref:LysM peptidoglycan-binding domain-containing protein n=1 Tax=Bacillus xiapuensis TaxID=2014075 RepID=UPI000C241635|nr:LysM peptidoglycan-binding domain-containing protein [Bacillus xiapuensis]
MKNFLFFLLVIVIAAGIWNDLTKGSLPHKETLAQRPEQANSTPDRAFAQPYETLQMKRGDTVLSILEELHTQGLPVTIQRAVKDFQQLNGGVAPEDVQPGQTYKFPVY